MNIKQSFQLAIKSIFANRLRSCLTMLGIIIGVAVVIILVSMMQGFSNSMVQSFENMGVNNIEAYLFPTDTEKRINLDDVEAFVADNSSVLLGVSPSISVYQATVSHKDMVITTGINGVNETYDELNSVELMYGTFFHYLDIKDSQNKCIIGAYVYNTLFNGGNPISKNIKINGKLYNVQGVLVEQYGGGKGSFDDVILIPYKSVYEISDTASIDTLNFSATSKDKMSIASSLIKKYLFNFYGDYESFTVSNMGETVKEMNNMMSILTAILIGIASISLIVGGIGIMNIMFVSVTERIKEIGIRTAIGATPADIMGQFIIEAITVSAMGGLIGIILGVVVSFFAAKIIKISFTLPISAIIIAVSVSAGIGILFGYLPAKKAALMNPIDALRRE